MGECPQHTRQREHEPRLQPPPPGPPARRTGSAEARRPQARCCQAAGDVPVGTAGGRDRHNRSETSHGSSKLDTRLRAQQRPGPGRAPERWRRRPHGDRTGTSPRSPAGPHSPTSTLRLGSVSPPPSPNRSYRNSVLLGALVPGRSRWTLVTAPGQGDRTNRQLRVRGRRSGDAGPARGLLGCGGRRRAEPGGAWEDASAAAGPVAAAAP